MYYKNGYLQFRSRLKHTSRGQTDQERYTWKGATYQYQIFLTKYGIVCPFKRNMLTADGQHFICPLNIGYILYQRVILDFRGLFLPERRVLQDMMGCPSAVNKCPFKRTYYNMFGKECFIFGNIICCTCRMYCLAPYTVPLGPTQIIVLQHIGFKFGEL